MKKTITVEDTEIRLFENAGQKEAFVSLTDIAQKFGEPRILIQNWMRTRGTLDFLGTWELLHNPDFKRIEFDAFKMEAGSTAFSMSPEKWIDGTDAVGMISRRGRYGGGTFGHRDLAVGFCYWIDLFHQRVSAAAKRTTRKPELGCSPTAYEGQLSYSRRCRAAKSGAAYRLEYPA